MVRQQESTRRKNGTERSPGGINRRKKSKQRNVNGFTTACRPDVNHLTGGKLTTPGRCSIGEKSIAVSFYRSL